MDVTCMTVKNTRDNIMNETPDDVPNIAFSANGNVEQKTLATQKELLQLVIERFLQTPAI